MKQINGLLQLMLSLISLSCTKLADVNTLQLDIHL